jgi:hypothetical protein
LINLKRSKVNITSFICTVARLSLRRCASRRARVTGLSFATALTRFLTAATPPAPAAQNLGAVLLRAVRGQTCGGMLGAMACIPLARPATPPYGPFNDHICAGSVSVSKFFCCL